MLVAWKGSRDEEEEARGAAAAAQLGLIGAGGAPGGAVRGRGEPASARVQEGRRRRRTGFPRRPGMARKRPLVVRSQRGFRLSPDLTLTAEGLAVRARTTQEPSDHGRTFHARWEPSTQSPTRRAGWARPPPPSTSPPAWPRRGIAPCSSTSIRSATPRSGWGSRRTSAPNIYDVLSGELALDARDARVRRRAPRRRALHARARRRERRAAAPRRLGDPPEGLARRRPRALPLHDPRLPALARARSR